MGVAEDEDVGRIPGEQPGWRRAAEFVSMTDVDGEAAGIERNLLRQQAIQRIDVAINGEYGRNGFQDMKDVTSADISCVEDL